MVMESDSDEYITTTRERNTQHPREVKGHLQQKEATQQPFLPRETSETAALKTIIQSTNSIS